MLIKFSLGSSCCNQRFFIWNCQNSVQCGSLFLDMILNLSTVTECSAF